MKRRKPTHTAKYQAIVGFVHMSAAARARFGLLAALACLLVPHISCVRRIAAVNVLCVDAFECSGVVGMPRCIAVTSAPHANELAKHAGLAEGMPTTVAQGVVPYDPERLHIHLAGLIGQMRSRMEVTIVVGPTFDAEERALIRAGFEGLGLGVVLGSRRDMPQSGGMHDAVLASLEKISLELEAEGLGVEQNGDFFQDLMQTHIAHAQAAYESFRNNKEL